MPQQLRGPLLGYRRLLQTRLPTSPTHNEMKRYKIVDNMGYAQDLFPAMQQMTLVDSHCRYYSCFHVWVGNNRSAKRRLQGEAFLPPCMAAAAATDGRGQRGGWLYLPVSYPFRSLHNCLFPFRLS